MTSDELIQKILIVKPGSQFGVVDFGGEVPDLTIYNNDTPVVIDNKIVLWNEHNSAAPPTEDEVNAISS